MSGRWAFRLAAGFALLFVLLGATFSHASAGGTSSITIHSRLCPTGYAGDTIFTDCHGNPQTSHLDFTIDGPLTETVATGDDGNVAFLGLPAGTYNISGGVPGEFASTVVYCSVENEPDNQVASTKTDTGYSIDLADNTNVICDWYNIPEDLSGNNGGTTTLPNTGVGAAADSNANMPLYGFTIAALGMCALGMRRRAMR